MPKSVTNNKIENYCESYISLLIEITTACNKKCSFCYNDRNNLTKIDRFRIQKIKNFVIKNSIDSIVLSGGEPLMHEEIFEIIKILNVHCKDVTIITNGLLLNEKIIRKLMKLKSIMLRVSIDIKEYSHIGNVVKLLNKHNIKYKLTITLYNINFEELKIFMQSIKDDYNGAFEMTFPFYKGNAVLTPNTLTSSVELLKNLIDLALYDGAKIDCDHISFTIKKYLQPNISHSNNCEVCRRIKCDISGNLYPCPYFTNEKFLIGNIDEGVNLKNSVSVAIKRLNLKNRKKCQSCEWLIFCRGGCLVAYEDQSIKIDYNCILFKNAYDHINNRLGFY